MRRKEGDRGGNKYAKGRVLGKREIKGLSECGGCGGNGAGAGTRPKDGIKGERKSDGSGILVDRTELNEWD